MARHAGRPGFAWRSAAPDRAARLRQDLLDLGLPAPCVAAAPCAARHLPTLDHPAAALGGAWVIEGSALGGGVLARRLDAVLAPGEPGGRAFFTPDPQQPARWRACCAAVEACGADPEGLAQMQHAARDTFAAFEIWLGAP